VLLEEPVRGLGERGAAREEILGDMGQWLGHGAVHTRPVEDTGTHRKEAKNAVAVNETEIRPVVFCFHDGETAGKWRSNAVQNCFKWRESAGNCVDSPAVLAALENVEHLIETHFHRQKDETGCHDVGCLDEY